MRSKARLLEQQHKSEQCNSVNLLCACADMLYAAPSCLLLLPVGVVLQHMTGKEFLFVADTLYAAFWEALDGLGLGWSFAEGAADRHSWTGLVMRLLAVGISIGGTLITALLLGLTSGKPAHLHIKNFRLLALMAHRQHCHDCCWGWRQASTHFCSQAHVGSSTFEQLATASCCPAAGADPRQISTFSQHGRHYCCAVWATLHARLCCSLVPRAMAEPACICECLAASKHPNNVAPALSAASSI